MKNEYVYYIGMTVIYTISVCVLFLTFSALNFQCQCINLNIPEDDDAHLIFLPLPSEAEATTEWIQKYEDLEQYFSNG